VEFNIGFVCSVIASPLDQFEKRNYLAVWKSAGPLSELKILFAHALNNHKRL